MKGEVALEDVESSWLVLDLRFFQPSVGNFGQLVELDKELPNHLFMDWFFIGPNALHLVPELHFEGLTEGLLNLKLICEVELHKASLADVKSLQVDLLKKVVDGALVPGLLSSKELRLVDLIEHFKLDEEPLSLSFHLLNEVESVLQKQLDEVEAENRSLFLELGLRQGAKFHLTVERNRLVNDSRLSCVLSQGRLNLLWNFACGRVERSLRVVVVQGQPKLQRSHPLLELVKDAEISVYAVVLSDKLQEWNSDSSEDNEITIVLNFSISDGVVGGLVVWE